MKRKESEYAIYCNSNYGPVFGFFDICIGYNCNEENSCYIENDGTNGYECDTEYKCSLFVNTDDLMKRIIFQFWIMKYLVLIMRIEIISTSYVNILIL